MDADIFDSEGFGITPPIFSGAECSAIESYMAGIGGEGIGTRNLLGNEWCKKLAVSLKETPLIRSILSSDHVAVQCTYFEKSKDQNWLVSVHQDLSIPVRDRVEHPELTGWSEKEGSIFVQPPTGVLEKLVAVRLHLDDCQMDDGPLKVVPGSHKLGRLNNESALNERNKRGETVCAVEKGAALLMRPLLLHASSKATGHSKRRVLHIVFGPSILPFGLRWQHAV
jgi:ectoine hydroxylase-related dioxygenase (phytanoyl-CoA dioxygenase family)